MLNIFHVFLSHLYVFLGEMSVRFFGPFFDWVIYFSGVEYLDSILKSREITLPTKVSLVKAMVFPVVMYGWESWTIKKAER